jgi:hypothetical protein
MKVATICALLALPIAASAQFKCVDAAGRVSFQQTPCAAQEKQQPLTLRSDVPTQPVAPSTTPAGAAPAAPTDQAASADQRMLRKMQSERRVIDLERAVQAVEFNIASRNVQMQNEFAALRGLKVSANNNLAGATYAQSLSTEMEAVASKYKALNDVDQERLKTLRADLATARQALGK